jgi:hypothetical protein
MGTEGHFNGRIKFSTCHLSAKSKSLEKKKSAIKINGL